jgi:hypothetical protein
MRRSLPGWTTTSSHDDAPGAIATRDCARWRRIARAIASASTQQRVEIRAVRVAFSTTEHPTGLPALLLTAERGRE